jgi:hypothetical protein
MKHETVDRGQTESHFSSIPYIVVGAFYGILVGNAFVLTASAVDKLLYLELPLGFDWPLFATRWGGIALGLALVGAVTALFHERLPGVLVGGVSASLLALGSALFLSPVTAGMKLMVLIFILMPIAAMSLPIALILRWMADKHAQALESKQPLTRVLPLVLLAIVLGVGSGYFLKMSRRGVEATRFLHHLLQTASQDAESPIRDLPGLQSHRDMSYILFPKPSETSREGFDIRVEYADGYSVNCTVVVYPGRDPYVSGCTSTSN